MKTHGRSDLGLGHGRLGLQTRALGVDDGDGLGQLVRVEQARGLRARRRRQQRRDRVGPEHQHRRPRQARVRHRKGRQRHVTEAQTP
jgi:hypothetical protein